MYPIEITEKNPDATMPLTVGAFVTCNTPDDVIVANIRANAQKRPDGWIKREPAHDLVAIMCGGGPSLADNLEKIGAEQIGGGRIFALNGAAQFLVKNGIVPDYQVIMDAQPATVGLIEPRAANHLFASMADPALFDAVPATLWHSIMPGMGTETFPWEGDYALIGGSYTVGNTAMGLVYAMGYRTMECYGYDSSHRDTQSHAYQQPMNDDDPLTTVEFGGKKYLCSLTMRLQAKWFVERAKALRVQGCKINVYGDGLLPAIFNAPPMSERDKYRAMWGKDEYRRYSPGASLARRFVDACAPKFTQTVVDLGCGTGRGGKMIRRLCGCEIAYVDFAENCLDDDLKDKPLLLTDIADINERLGDFVYCTDVLEHIPPERLEATMRGILAAAPMAFLQISTEEDGCGELIGQTLHMNICNAATWLEYMQTLPCRVLLFEDRGGTVIFLLSQE